MLHSPYKPAGNDKTCTNYGINLSVSTKFKLANGTFENGNSDCLRT